MLTSVSFSFRGLWIEGGAEYDRGDYWNPPTGDAEIDSIILDDAEEFLSWCIMEDFSEPVANMVEAGVRLTETLSPSLLALVWKKWEEEMFEALWEEFSSYDPRDDYADDRD